MIAGDMSCEVRSMNSFRSSLPAGGGNRLPSSPLLSQKKKRGAESDDLTSIPIARDSRRNADHRDGDRHRLADEKIRIDHAGESREAELINLSGGGAMVEVDFTPRLWDRVELHLGSGVPIECAVRWVRDNRLGLEFAHETRIGASPEERDSILLNVIRRTFPDVNEVPTEEPLHNQSPPSPVVDEARRVERRHPLIWNGQLLYNHDEHAVRLRNISATGALVECHSTVPEGAEVMLDLGSEVSIFARVSWNRGDQYGLAFTSPFDLARLAETRSPEVAPTRWSRPTFLNAGQGAENAWADGWARPSIDKLREDLEGFLKH
jgi:hypothetical protein